MYSRVAHEQGFDVELFAQAVGGNEVEAEVEFSEVEDFYRQRAARNRSASCQMRSLGLYGALNLRGSVTVGLSL